MGLTPAQRITMIRECSTLLDKQGWTDIDLVLEQHGIGTSDYWQGDADDHGGYVQAMIKFTPDDALEALHTYLQAESGSGVPGDSPFQGDQVRVFFSHLAAKRDMVGAVSRSLSIFGVQAFVAHDDIQPSKEWQGVIEAALASCDAMVVFLHGGFDTSRWCDQEVGWAMGRNRPVVPLAFDLNPYGFMGKYQARTCAGQTPPAIADAIMEWLVTMPSLHGRLATSLSQAFAGSRSYDSTRRIAAMLSKMQTFSDDDLDRITEAATKNGQVFDCGIDGMDGPKWVRRFVRARRAPTTAGTGSLSSVDP